MQTKYLKNAIPFLILFGLMALLWQSLSTSHANTVQDALVGEKLPAFELQDVRNPMKSLTRNSLKGRVTLLNFWASWCPACRSEHGMLMKIKNKYHVPIYGIAYKDSNQAIRELLQRHGDPFTLVGNDTSGQLAVDLGIYGTPETFIIGKNGEILYRHIGVINQRTWDRVLLPIIKRNS